MIGILDVLDGQGWTTENDGSHKEIHHCGDKAHFTRWRPMVGSV
jgi:hypothetical protein